MDLRQYVEPGEEDNSSILDPKELPAVLTVVEQVYFRPSGEEAQSWDARYNRQIFTDEQPYTRRSKVTEEWEDLDCGWLGINVGLLIVENGEGKFPHRIPTPEQQREANRKILVISYSKRDDERWVIRPGETMRAYPSDTGKLYIRSLYDVTRYSIHLFPK